MVGGGARAIKRLNNSAAVAMFLGQTTPLIYGVTAILLSHIAYTLFPPSLQELLFIHQYGSKKLLFDKSMQQHIENELFYNYWRTPTQDKLYQLERVLDVALRLPLYKKDLAYNEESFSKSFKNYPSDIIEQLRKVTKAELAFRKMEPAPDQHYIIYLHGEPGTGKTHAAKKIAEAMGTELVTVILDGASIKDITGTPATDADPKPGKLLEAITNTPSRDTINFSNKVLLIDEFDRLITADDDNSRSVLSYMLKVLDSSSHQTFESKFLKSKLPLPDTIVLTGNSDIEALSAKSPRFKALASRIESIHFPGFDQQAKSAIAETLISKLETSYQSMGEEHKNFRITSVEKDMIATFIAHDQDPGLRSMQKYIYTLFKNMIDAPPTPPEDSEPECTAPHQCSGECQTQTQAL